MFTISSGIRVVKSTNVYCVLKRKSYKTLLLTRRTVAFYDDKKKEQFSICQRITIRLGIITACSVRIIHVQSTKLWLI